MGYNKLQITKDDIEMAHLVLAGAVVKDIAESRGSSVATVKRSLNRGLTRMFSKDIGRLLLHGDRSIPQNNIIWTMGADHCAHVRDFIYMEVMHCMSLIYRHGRFFFQDILGKENCYHAMMNMRSVMEALDTIDKLEDMCARHRLYLRKMVLNSPYAAHFDTSDENMLLSINFFDPDLSSMINNNLSEKLRTHAELSLVSDASIRRIRCIGKSSLADLHDYAKKHGISRDKATHSFEIKWDQDRLIA
jgi:hypothetical protein